MEIHSDGAVYDKYIKSEIITHCLKKCLDGSRLSPAVKLKVLSLMYENHNILEESTRSEYTTFKTNTVIDIKQLNYLGIDDDLLLENTEKLSSDQQGQLKECISDELTAYHKFCTILKSKVKIPGVEGEINNILEDLEDQLLKQSSQLSNLFDAQNGFIKVKSESDSFLNDAIDSGVNGFENLKHSGKKLLEEIDKEIMAGDRQFYLEKAERILENKIERANEKIEKLKLELMDLNIKY